MNAAPEQPRGPTAEAARISEGGVRFAGRFVPAASVIVTDLDDDFLLLDSSSGQMFALSETGRCVWQALDQGVEGAVTALVASFEVTADRARADVLALVEAMVEAELIAPADEDL